MKKKLFKLIEENVDDSLLKPEYKKQIKPGDHPVKGHCYVAAEVVYHLYGKQKGYYPHVMRIEGGTHWFLKKGNKILDPSGQQFNEPVDYNKGRKCGFLTNKPSKRAKLLIAKIAA